MRLSPETCRVKPKRNCCILLDLFHQYIKSVLWRVAKYLSYIEEARCLKVNLLSFVACQWQVAVICDRTGERGHLPDTLQHGTCSICRCLIRLHATLQDQPRSTHETHYVLIPRNGASVQFHFYFRADFDPLYFTVCLSSASVYSLLKSAGLQYIFFSCGAAAQLGLWPPQSLRFLDHTQRRITVGRTPLDE